MRRLGIGTVIGLLLFLFITGIAIATPKFSIEDAMGNTMAWINQSGTLNISEDFQCDGCINLEDINMDMLNTTINQSINNSNITWGEIVGFTVNTRTGIITNGSLVGYAAANAICNSEYPGAHFCLEVEIMKTISNGQYWTGEVWMAKGAPGYTAAANDCEGWTKTSGEIGPYWDWAESAGGGAGKLTPCSSTLKLACCR